MGLLASVGFLVIVVACRSREPVGKADAIRQGDAHVGNKQYTEAVAAYRVATDADPSDGHVHLKLANAYVLAGDSLRALTESVEAANLLPLDVEAQLLAANLTLSQGRYQDAADRMAPLLRDHPDNVTALILLGNAKARLFNSIWALYALTDPLINDHFEGARENLRPLAPEQDDQDAEDAFREALRLAPTTTEARLALVNFLWATGRPDEGEAMLRKTADEMPGHAAVNHALGAFYLSRHRETDAFRYLKNAAASADWGAGARFALADYYIATDRDAEALSILNAMTPADDAAGAVSVRIAPIEFRAGKHDEAMRRVDALLARHAAHAALPKAQFLLAANHADKALPFARTAAGEDPWSAEARSAFGQALSATGDLEGARREYVDATKFRPTAARLFLELADVLVALKLPDQALLYARDAVGLTPGDPGAEILLIKALRLKKDPLGAEQVLQRLRKRYGPSVDALMQLRVVPDSAMYHYHLGSGYRTAGELKRARTEFTRALQIDPKFTYADQARAALGSIPP